MNENKHKTESTANQRAVAVLVLMASIALVYYRTLGNPFVWDDPFLIQNNYFIQNLSNLKLIFTHNYFTQSIELSYRPVATLTFFTDYALWGARPIGWHFFNIALHFLNSLLFFTLAARLLRRPWLAIGLSLLFALHPIQTEAINGVTFREDLLCTFFCMASLLVYTGAAENSLRRIFRIAGSLLLLLLALFSKETAVVFPLLILLYEYLFVDVPSRRRAWTMIALFFMPVIFYLYIRFGPMLGPRQDIVYQGNSFWATMLIMPQAWARYILLSLWPARQCVDHVFSESPNLTDPATITSFFVLAAAVGCALAASIRNRKAAFGVAWFVLMLLPVSNIIPIGVVMAERYLYIAVPGLLLFLGVVVEDVLLSGKARYPSLIRIVIFVCFAAAILGCGASTLERNKVWKSEVSFWKAGCECAPTSARTLVNLGVAYLNNNDLAGAERALVIAQRFAAQDTRTDRRYGTLYRSLSNLGIVYARQNRMNKAVILFAAAARLNRNSPYVFWNLGMAYFRTGQIEKAKNAFERGIEIDPRNINPRIYLISIYHHTGRLKQAIEQCDRILELTPGNSTIRELRARLVRESGG
jgi:protein O-mannosyl-transferase